MAEPLPTPAALARAGALIAANRLSEARSLVDATRHADPEASAGLYLDGVLRLREGRAADAAALLSRAVARPDANPAWNLAYGQALDAAGRLDEAAGVFEAAASRTPNLPEPWYCLGVARARQARWPEAESAFARAAEADPGRIESQHQLAVALREQGELVRAVEVLRRMLAARPGYLAGAKELGTLLARLGRLEDAIAVLASARERAPGDAEILNNLGFALLATGRFAEAAPVLDAALAAAPGLAAAHANRGVVHHALGETGAAIAAYERALAIDPAHGEARVNLALACLRGGDAGRAREEAARAEATPRASAEATKNLGQLRRELGEPQAAAALYDEALAIDARYDPARFCRATLHLACGRWREGWADYRARPTRATHPLVRSHGAARFADEPLSASLAGRRFLLVDEQGLGDVLFFLRFAPSLAARGAELAFHGDGRLLPVVARTGLFSTLAAREEPPDESREWILVPDLPRLLAGQAPPPPLPLVADPGRVAAMRARLEAAGPRPWVGLTWRSGIRPPGEWITTFYKEAPLPALLAALRERPFTAVSLQREPGAGETEAVGRGLGRDVLDLSGANADLEDALAVLALLDAYVGVSNTNTHLRAGLGLACDVLVPHPPEWRWMEAGESSPWFPGCRVYREVPGAGWAKALAALGRDLGAAW